MQASPVAGEGYRGRAHIPKPIPLHSVERVMVDMLRRAEVVRDPAAVGGRTRAPGRLAVFLRSLNLWFWAIVGLPTLLAGVYFFAIASDLYLSEVKFLVRGPAKTSSNLLSAMFSGAGISATSEDTQAVH